MENRASASASTSATNHLSQLNGKSPYPTDTLGAIHYLLSLLRPQQVRQQKSFPRVCMVHQLYSIIHDNTAVDRALANLIKENTIRKFYLGGTGSDEFAIMLTSDYVAQILQAKEQYLADLQQQSQLQDSSPSSRKRKSDISVLSNVTKKVTLNFKSMAPRAATTTRASMTMTNALSGSQEEAGEIFDRFKELVTNGHCMEISIQHSNIQSVIGATDQDIT
ncbi:hypothetical protein EDD21DRAFT_359044 [Dissophora ornata]|nr:hypothetical protein EDD21DRAFT_359044 [Dissophora ornata]